MFWHAALLHTLKIYSVSGWIFDLINDGFSKSFHINAGVPPICSIIKPTLFLFSITNILDVIISQLDINADYTISLNGKLNLTDEVKLASDFQINLQSIDS